MTRTSTNDKDKPSITLTHNVAIIIVSTDSPEYKAILQILTDKTKPPLILS